MPSFAEATWYLIAFEAQLRAGFVGIDVGFIGHKNIGQRVIFARRDQRNRWRNHANGGTILPIFKMSGHGGTRSPNALISMGGKAAKFVTSHPEVAIYLALVTLIFSSCAAPDTDHHIVVSARDQKLALLEKGKLVATYPVSTSKFCLSDRPGSYGTPVGELEIADKIGDGALPGTVFKDRRRTGEVIAVDAPGRDPIVTRILWLRGLQPQNANAFGRDIYIHGTPEERNIGRPASYGCIRMRSRDVISLYNIVGRGARVSIVDAPLATVIPDMTSASSMAESNHALGVIR